MYPSRLSALRLGLSLLTGLALAGCDGGDTGPDDTADPADCDSGAPVETGAAACADFAMSAASTSIIAGQSVDVTVAGATGGTSLRTFRGERSDGELSTGEGPTLTATFAPTLAGTHTLVATDEAGCTASVDVVVAPGPAAALSTEVGPQAYEEETGELVRRGTVRVLDAYGNPLPLSEADLAIDAPPRGIVIDTGESTADTVVLRATARDEWATGDVAVRYEEWSASLDLSLVPQEMRVGEPGGGEDLPGVEEGGSAFLYPTLYVPAGEAPVYGWTTSFVVSGAAAPNVYVSERPSESRGCTWDWSVEDLGAEGAAVTVTGECEAPFEAGTHQPVQVEIVDVVADQVIEVGPATVELASAAGEWFAGGLREQAVTLRGKPRKKVCVSFWYIGTTTQANIALDLQNAQRILRANSQRCTCPRFYEITSTLHPLSTADYLTLINLEEPPTWFSDHEMAAIAKANRLRDSSCINVYYGRIHYPFTSGGVSYETAAGLSYDGGSTAATAGAIFIDTYYGRGITLAHELVHKGSGNAVLDSPKDGGQTPQGANTPKNLFNYADEGELLTKTQCDLFDMNLP